MEETLVVNLTYGDKMICDSAFEVLCRDPSHLLAAHLLMPEIGVRNESSEQVTREVA